MPPLRSRPRSQAPGPASRRRSRASRSPVTGPTPRSPRRSRAPHGAGIAPPRSWNGSSLAPRTHAKVVRHGGSLPRRHLRVRGLRPRLPGSLAGRPAVLFLALFLVFLNGFFVATEFAIVKVRATRLRELAEGGSSAARTGEKVVGQLTAYLSACQLGITGASLGLGWVGEAAFAHILEPFFHAPVPWAAVPAAHAVALTLAFTL